MTALIETVSHNRPPMSPPRSRASRIATARPSRSTMSRSRFRRRMTGLIGPDGVGKSTLLGLVAGVRKIQTGEVRALDGDLKDAAFRQGAYARIAYMPQGLGRNLYPTLSVFETSTSLAGYSAREGGAESAHRRSDSLDRPRPVPRAARRQAFRRHEAEAVALLLADPRSDLLILDEPTTGVDPLSRAVLGADRPHSRAAAAYERGGRNRLYGGG